MFTNIMIVMSLAGSMVVVCYLILYFLIKKHFSLKCQSLILKLALFLYLVPVSEQKYYIMWGVRTLFPAVGRLWEPRGIVVTDRTHVIHVNGEEREFAPQLKLLYLVVAGMLFVSCILMIWQLIKYMQFRRICRDTASELPRQAWEEQFFQIKEQLGIRRKVKLVCSGFCQSPMAFGVIFPVVVFPKSGLDDPWQREYMMKHELTHIKQGDLFFRFLALIAAAIHWFNPAVYFLYFELTAVSEMVCDRSVLGSSDDGVRRSYSNLVLDCAADRDCTYFSAIGFADKWSMKRRILEMKKDRKVYKLLSGITVAAMCLAGSLTVFAYTPPEVYEADEEYDFSEDIVMIMDDELEKIFAEEVPYDYFFQGEDGEIYPLTEEGESTYSGCSHTKRKKGQMVRHVKNAKGGCKIKYYRARICVECGDKKRGKLIDTVTHTVCPH